MPAVDVQTGMVGTRGTRAWRTSSVGEGHAFHACAGINAKYPFRAFYRVRSTAPEFWHSPYPELLQTFNNDFLVNSFIITNFAAEVYYHSYSL